MRYPESQFGSRLQRLSWLWLLAGLSVGGYLISTSGNEGGASPRADALPLTTASMDETVPAESPPHRLVDIERIAVGDRVLAENPELEESPEFVEPHPATWRRLELEMRKSDGGLLSITMLRPVSWLEEREAEIGETIDIGLPELNVYGSATLLGVDACPEIRSGPGRVVLSTFRHTSSDILDLRVSGQPEAIGTTEDHPFWSEDRLCFVPAADLRSGERFRAASGETAVLTSATTRPSPEPVYDLEVQGEHTYFVGTLGLLAHNNEAYGANRAIALGKDIPGGGYKALAEQTSASRWQHWARDGITRRSVTNRFGRAYHQAAQ